MAYGDGFGRDMKWSYVSENEQTGQINMDSINTLRRTVFR
jgi:hypothetical protein